MSAPLLPALKASAIDVLVPARGALSWFAPMTRAVAAGLLATVAGLVVWSVLPVLLGWSSHVVVSGSMQPRILGGDVVLSQPVRTADLTPGQVLVFDDPAAPGRLLVHRLVRVDDEGNLVTRGDANQGDDSTAVPPEAVMGMGRLRIPFVGLPFLWRHDGKALHLAAACAALAATVALVIRDRDDDPPASS